MILEVFVWFLSVEILGFLALPLSVFVCKNLPDRGYSISKIIGVLLLSYLSWVIGHAVAYNGLTVLFSFVVLLFSAVVLGGKVDIIKVLRKNRKTFLIMEMVFLISFLFFIIIRAQTPAINGLEKFMDFTTINGILRSERLPPQDPWLSGHNMNYYYFGHFTIATLTKLTHLPSYITFNLGLATVFSLLSVGSFGVLFNMTKRYKYGLIAVLFVVLMSNSFGFIQLITFINPRLIQPLSSGLNLEYPLTCCSNPRASLIDKLSTFPVWPSTRIIPNTINEFPYSNFLFGELHAHAMSMPFQILFLSLVLNLILSKSKGVSIFGKSSSEKLIGIMLVSLSLGVIFVTNSWDYPTYGALLGFGVLVKNVSWKRAGFGKNITRDVLFPLISILLLSFLLFAFYHFSVKRTPSYGLVNERTDLAHFIIIFLVFLFLIFSFFFQKFGKKEFLSIFAISIILGVLLKIQLLVVVIPLLYFSFKILLKRPKDGCLVFVLMLVIFGSFVTLLTEIFYIDSRYNTIFKLYYHIWIFWGLASAYVLFLLRKSFSPHIRKRVFFVNVFILSFLVLACLVLSVFATVHRISIGSRDGITLNGLDYMKKSHRYDYEAISWLNDNVKGTPVILEAPGDAFTYSSQVSANTGLPTVIGWTNHEFVWRGVWFTNRTDDIKTIYETENNSEATELLQKYNVRYIYIGDMERDKYQKNGLDKFSIESSYRLVYENEGVKIFEFLES